MRAARPGAGCGCSGKGGAGNWRRGSCIFTRAAAAASSAMVILRWRGSVDSPWNDAIAALLPSFESKIWDRRLQRTGTRPWAFHRQTTRRCSMPAKSAAQQKAAGAALSAKRGETPKSKLKGASKSMEKSMSEKQLEEFAHTKRKGKPEHAAK